MAARPTLPELAARVPEDVDDEPSAVVVALQQGLARMQQAIEGHPSGDLSPIAERLERIAARTAK